MQNVLYVDNLHEMANLICGKNEKKNVSNYFLLIFLPSVVSIKNLKKKKKKKNTTDDSHEMSRNFLGNFGAKIFIVSSADI